MFCVRTSPLELQDFSASEIQELWYYWDDFQEILCDLPRNQLSVYQNLVESVQVLSFPSIFLTLTLLTAQNNLIIVFYDDSPQVLLKQGYWFQDD